MSIKNGISPYHVPEPQGRASSSGTSAPSPGPLFHIRYLGTSPTKGTTHGSISLSTSFAWLCQILGGPFPSTMLSKIKLGSHSHAMTNPHCKQPLKVSTSHEMRAADPSTTSCRHLKHPENFRRGCRSQRGKQSSACVTSDRCCVNQPRLRCTLSSHHQY